MEVEEIEPAVVKLNSLKDIATLISSICGFIGESFYFFLQISYLIGNFIVNQTINFTSYILYVLEIISSTLSILYEDSLIFFEDFGQKCLFILSFCIQGVETVINGLMNGIFSIGDGVIKIGECISSVKNLFYLSSMSVISFCKEAAVLTKQMLILLGSSIWLCFTLIPTVTLASYNFIVQCVSDFINKSQNLILVFLDRLSNLLHELLIFFFDLPINSGAGLLLGLLILFLIVISFDKICSLILHGVNKTYNSLISFTSNLWSGKFLENKNKTEVNNGHLYHQDLNDDKLCIVCQENPKEIIYLPCGHFCLCKDCSNQIRKTQKNCPVCRKQVKRTSRVYT